MTRPRFAVGHLRRRLSRSLDRNPIGWLQQYSWSGRITKWGWFTVILFAECIMLNNLDDFGKIQIWLVLLLLVGMAFSASASFRRERECGALELLLVCPLSVAQIIGGRLRGIWMQFLPTSALLGLCLFVSADIERYSGEEALFWTLLLPAFIALPIVGLYFSTERINFLFAWLLTLFFGIVTPLLFLFPVMLVYQIENPVAGLVLVQILLGVLFWRLLYLRLENRRFAFAHV